MNTEPHRRSWETEDYERLFFNLIGLDFGKKPWTRIPEIIASKELIATQILDDLQMRDKTGYHGLEVGVGFGYQSRVFGKNAERFYGCDISDSYLNRARLYCDDMPHTTFHRIEFANLEFIPRATLDFAVIHNVFIHLGFYEIVAYLRQVHAALKPGGKFWFDFMEIEKLDTENDELYKYMQHETILCPENRAAVQYNSWIAIEKVVKNLGFNILDSRRAANGPGLGVIAQKA